uniref:PUM-HD domain-containing protein n=1 Tax=Ditylenchus dipsaci TaxID=166011 RepID=A0A915DPG4_9BILA
MLDVFGNYVIQKFFEIGTADQRAKLAAAIKGNVLKLALQMYGCRVLQTAFAFIDFDLQEGILKEMEGQILRCVKDQNGNHVVQKIIDSVEPQRWQFIIDAFVNSSPNTVLTLSTHTYGCRVIQRALEFAEKSKATTSGSALQKHSGVGQEISMLSQVRSNVLEKCLTFGLTAHKRGLILKLCGDREKSPLLELVKDPFANYVVQKMLELSCGKFIIAKLSKYYPKKNIKSGPPPARRQLVSSLFFDDDERSSDFYCASNFAS